MRSRETRATLVLLLVLSLGGDTGTGGDIDGSFRRESEQGLHLDGGEEVGRAAATHTTLLLDYNASTSNNNSSTSSSNSNSSNSISNNNNSSSKK